MEGFTFLKKQHMCLQVLFDGSSVSGKPTEVYQAEVD
jgi:hypothetical protein